MIRAEHMAEIYGNRAGRFAIAEVTGILRYYSAAPKTVAYWETVMDCLQRRFR